MCNVCVSGSAIRATRKGEALEVGWGNGPGSPDVRIYLQMRGRDAESSGEYRLKRENGRWTKWTWVHDLATAAGLYGFDVKWRVLRRGGLVQRWVLEGGACPTFRQLIEEIEERPRRRYRHGKRKRTQQRHTKEDT